jgi:hypothetical protein
MLDWQGSARATTGSNSSPLQPSGGQDCQTRRDLRSQLCRDHKTISRTFTEIQFTINAASCICADQRLRPQRVTLWPRLTSCIQDSAQRRASGRHTLSSERIWLETRRSRCVAGGVNRVGATTTSHHRPIFPSSHFIERLPCSKLVSAP